MNSKRDQFVGTAARPSRTPVAIASIAALLLALIAVAVVARGRLADGGVSSARAGSDVTIPLADLSDGLARFYRYTTAAGREVRFFVMRSSDGVVRAAFDSCDVCYREQKGYRQEGDAMVCVNCSQRFRSTDINEVRGGCNPAPLERVVHGDHVLLSGATLSAGAWYF